MVVAIVDSVIPLDMPPVIVLVDAVAVHQMIAGCLLLRSRFLGTKSQRYRLSVRPGIMHELWLYKAE